MFGIAEGLPVVSSVDEEDTPGSLADPRVVVGRGGSGTGFYVSKVLRLEYDKLKRMVETGAVQARRPMAPRQRFWNWYRPMPTAQQLLLW